MLSKKPEILWFTGLSGSGKTTIASELKKHLETRGYRVHLVDADEVRASYTEPLGFSREEIRENNRRHALMAQRHLADHDFVIVTIISPFAEDRAMVQELLGDSLKFLYVKATLDTVIKRDTKGLYAQALRGEKNNVIGMPGSTIPYEPPHDAHIEVCTDEASLPDCIEKIFKTII